MMTQFKNKFLENDGSLKNNLKKDLNLLYPNYMKNYIEHSFESWIDNAIKAPTMIENRDFLKKNNNIIPIDFSNTGAIQSNMVWDEGLQQFLQIIHDEKGTYENENTNFLSNISFFKRYNGNIFGVTGTLGSESFRYILREVYKVNLIIIPPWTPTKLIKEKESLIFKYNEDKEYNEAILKNIDENIKREKSILLICNSIKEGESFYNKLLEIYSKEQVMKYFTEEDNATIERELQIKQIIVATNLAGRGTDIKISKELEQKGGLHVIISFLPLNQRIERQNCGRAGRNGQRGTHILIMKYDNGYGILNGSDLNIKTLSKLRDEDELKNTKEMIEKEGEFIQQKEEIFKDCCDFLNSNCKGVDKFVRADIEERWGIILKSKDIPEIKDKYEKFKKDDIKNIKNYLIRIKKICKYSERDTNIFELEPEYSWNARIVYACSLAKDKVPKNGDLGDKNEAIKQLEIAKKIIDDYFLQDLSALTVLNNIIFSRFAQNIEKMKNESFKTKIELQNEQRKNFLEAIKSLIDENKNTIEKFVREYKKDDVIEKKENLTVIDIINKSNKIDPNYKEDIQIYMEEFGFERFEILVINKRFHLINNIIVFALGILEICVGTALIFACKHPKALKFAKFLIRDGIENVVESLKNTIQGKEMDLKEFAKKKAVKLLYFTLELITGVGEKSGEYDFKTIMFQEITRKCKEELINYGSTKAAEGLIKLINENLSKGIKDNFIGIALQENHDIYILNDLLKNRDNYKYYILEKIETFLSGSEELTQLFMNLIEFIKNLADKNKVGLEKFQAFLNFTKNFNFRGFHNCIVHCVEFIKNSKVKYEVNKDGDLFLLSNIFKDIDNNLTQEKIDNICKELIEYGAIKNTSFLFVSNWEFNKKYIDDKDIKFPKILKLKVDDKYKKIRYKKEKEKEIIPYETLTYLNKITNRLSLKALNNKKQQIKDEAYKIIERHLSQNLKIILDYLMNKTCEKVENLIEKYIISKRANKPGNKKNENKKKDEKGNKDKSSGNKKDKNNKNNKKGEDNKIDRNHESDGGVDDSLCEEEIDDYKENSNSDSDEDKKEKNCRGKENIKLNNKEKKGCVDDSPCEEEIDDYKENSNSDSDEDKKEKNCRGKENKKQLNNKVKKDNSYNDKIKSLAKEEIKNCSKKGIEKIIEKIIEKGKNSKKKIEIFQKNRLKSKLCSERKFRGNKYVKTFKYKDIANYAEKGKKIMGKLCSVKKVYDDIKNVYNDVNEVYDEYKKDGNIIGENCKNKLIEKAVDKVVDFGAPILLGPIAGPLAGEHIKEPIKDKCKNLCGLKKPKEENQEKEPNEKEQEE